MAMHRGDHPGAAALSWRARLAAAAMLVAMAACTTSGSSFDTASMDLLIPGQTTLDEASALLKSDPTDIYRQQNGAATARWAHHSSLVTDAIYFNRELWLYFDETGVFRRIVKSNNVPMAEQKIGQPQPATPVTSPVSQQSSNEPEIIVIPGTGEL